MNQTFYNNATQLGFVLENKVYELSKDNIYYQLPNQKLPFLKNDFYVKNSYADFNIDDTEISITIFDGSEFEIQLNHYRSVKGTINKNNQLLIANSTLNDKERIFYNENQERIEQVGNQLLEIHKSVYSR